MGAIIFGWALKGLPYILGALAVFALIAGAKHELNKWADNRAAPKILAAQAETEAAKAELSRYRDQQLAYAAQMAAGYKSAFDRAQQKGQELDDANAKYATLSERAQKLANRLALVPADTARLLRDSIAAASANPTPATGPAPVANQPPADTVTEGDRIDWEVAMTRWANECRTIAQGWQTFYANLRGQGAAAPK